MSPLMWPSVPGIGSIAKRRVALPALFASALAAAPALATEKPAGSSGAGFGVSSTAFAEGGAIPRQATCDGADRSPPLRWERAPAGAQAFALVVEDPDAPSGTFTHWVIYDIPGAARALGEGVPREAALGDGTLQGRNDFGRLGWNGPCPPRGPAHRYVFRLFALSAPVAPASERSAPRAALDRKQLLAAIRSTTLAETEVSGLYERAR